MNKVFFLALLFCLLVGIVFPLLAQEEKLVKMVIGNPYPPLFWLNAQGKPQGIIVEILKKLEEKTPLRFEITALPFSQALEKTLNGEFDAISLIFKTQERERKLLFSEPVLGIEGWVYKERSLPASSARELTPHLVGAVQGDVNVKVLKKKYPNLIFVYFSDLEGLIQAARRGEIKVLAMEKFTAQYYLLKYNLLTRFRPLEEIGKQWAYFALPPERKELLPLLNQGLSSISKKEWEEIISPFLGEKVPVWSRPDTILLIIIGGSLGFLLLLLFLNSYLRKEVTKQTEKAKKAYEETRKAHQRFEKSLDITYSLRAETQEEEFLRKNLELLSELLPQLEALLVIVPKAEEKSFKLHYQAGSEHQVLPLSFSELPDDPQVIYSLLKEKLNSITIPSLTRFPDLALPFRDNEKLIGALFLWGEKLEQQKNLIYKLQHNLFLFYLLKHYSQKEKFLREQIITAVLKALEYYDPYTQGHSERVAHYALWIGNILGVDEETRQSLYQAGLLHDIGKIAIPRHILIKKETLKEEEYQAVKEHPRKSYELLKDIEGLEEVATICLYHHEHYDGAGYPEGLAGEAIPFLSRLLAVADSFDAMTSERPYRKTLTFEEALLELHLCAGGQFDPQIITAVLNHRDLLEEEFNELTGKKIQHTSRKEKA